MRIAWVISFITALAACSSEPPVARLDDLGRGKGEGKAPSAKTTPPIEDASTEADDDLFGQATPPRDDAGADAGAGVECLPDDVKEIQGTDTLFTHSACGRIDVAGDEDFFVLDVAAPRTLTLRVTARADAVARLTTANGNVVAVNSGASGTVGSAAGRAVVRVRSKLGAIQSYRIIVE